MRLLIAEDDVRVAQILAAGVTTQGYVPEIVGDGEEAWFRGSSEEYAAIILDLGLPKLDGMTILRRWRSEKITTPVVILSARGTWAERVEGIDAGADDYLPKPFEMEELLARLRAVLRRGSQTTSSIIEVGSLRLDLRTGTTKKAGLPISLTPLEFRLLQHLVVSRDRAVTKEELAEQLYAVNHDRDGNAIEAVISRLRRKLGSKVIESRRGFGYQLAAEGP